MMKNLFTAVFAVFLMISRLPAQECGMPQSQIDLHGNNIKARLLNAGDMFWDLNKAQFIPNPSPNGTGPATIFAAALWMGGLDPAGGLELAANTYRSAGKTDYFAGPLALSNGETTAGDCSNWDRHFKVRGDRINIFLSVLPVLANDPGFAQAQFPDIMGWPAVGNPYFADLMGFDLPSDVYTLAPFVDVDGDGGYNPLHGDYPAVRLNQHAPFVPTEMVWCVFNDQGAGAVHSASQGVPIGVEVQFTAWAFDSVSQPLLANTVFTSHRMIFHTTEPLDSFYVGMWVDFDLGCYTDDYLGCAPDLHSFYAYNQDAVDGSTGNTCVGGVPTFSGAAPVQSATFLNLSLDKCITISNPSVGSPFPGENDPASPIHYYRFLTGHWNNGDPLTFGGNGYGTGAPTNFIFPTDPADPNGWSMCTAGLPSADRRILGAHNLGQIVPGQVAELNMAWTVHPNPLLPCGLGTTYTDIATIHELYQNDFVTATTTLLPDAGVTLAPNPAAHNVTIGYGDLSVLEIRCFDAAGRLVRVMRDLPTQQYELDLGGWRTGTYTLQLVTRTGLVAKRLAVLR